MTRLAVIGMVIASPAILYALARLAVVFPALLLERLTPLEALRRAFRLTSGSAVPILALILVATFLYLFLQLALGTVVRWVFMRSEERRVGKECVSTCSSWWWP